KKLAEQEYRAIAVLDTGFVDHGRQQMPFCVRQNMTFAAHDLLPASWPRGPAASVAFTEWLSMIAAVGLASPPPRWRAAMTNVRFTRSQVPLALKRRNQ